jgi:hypothetical protein
MKIQLFLIALLVMSVFAGSVALAQESEIEIEAESSIEGSNDASLETEVDSSVDSSRFRGFPAEVHMGTGWAIDDGKGYLMTLTWVSKVFVSKDSPTTTGKEVTRGLVRVGDMKYMFSAEQTAETGISKEFVIYSSRGKDASKVGTLTLKKQGSYGDLTTWLGELVIGDTSYELHVATTERPVRSTGKDNSDKKVIGQSLEVECYDGVKESFALEGASSTEQAYTKARVFCENHCKDGKCGVNKARTVDVRSTTEIDAKVDGQNHGISIDEESSVSGNTKVDATPRGLVGFWKRVFSRAATDSSSN